VGLSRIPHASLGRRYVACTTPYEPIVTISIHLHQAQKLEYDLKFSRR
jgi:hypothetical protein